MSLSLSLSLFLWLFVEEGELGDGIEGLLVVGELGEEEEMLTRDRAAFGSYFGGGGGLLEAGGGLGGWRGEGGKKGKGEGGRGKSVRRLGEKLGRRGCGIFAFSLRESKGFEDCGKRKRKIEEERERG